MITNPSREIMTNGDNVMRINFIIYYGYNVICFSLLCSNSSIIYFNKITFLTDDVNIG